MHKWPFASLRFDIFSDFRLYPKILILAPFAPKNITLL